MILDEKRDFMTPGKRIKRLRVQSDLGQKNLADELGYKTYTTISKWESDKSLPPGRELKKLAQFFGVSIDYILGLDDLLRMNNISSISDTVGLPFYESFDEALLARESNEYNQEVVRASNLILRENKDHYFVLEVKTDSVNQLTPPQSNMVILDFAVAEDKSLETGDIIVIQLEGKHRILTLRKTDLMIYLEPASYIDGFETITFTTEEFNELHLIGKVVATYQIFD